MITQCWVTREDTVLCGVSHWPSNRQVEGGVILFSGFSQPMCDIDYYMSKLSKSLVSQGLYVLQIDLTGHGDSYGELHNVMLDTIRIDIETAIEYVRKLVGNRIICVGRGLAATIAAEYLNRNLIVGVCGVGPYCMDPERVNYMWKDINPRIYEIAEIFQGCDFIKLSDFDPEKAAFFNALGGDSINLHGQKISGGFLTQLSKYDPYNTLSLSKDRSLWLIPSEDEKDSMKKWIPDEFNKYIPSITEKMHYLPRNPLWHFNSINRICDWIKERLMAN